MSIKMENDEVLELARRYEDSGGFETALGDALRPHVKDELDRIANSRPNGGEMKTPWKHALIVIGFVLVALSLAIIVVAGPMTGGPAAAIILAALVISPIGAIMLGLVMSANTIPEYDKEYGKLLAAYRMLGGDEAGLKPYEGIEAAEREAAKIREQKAGAEPRPAAPAAQQPDDTFVE